MNKVRPGSIARVDKREDGVVRTSNVTKFLALCSSTLGHPSEDLFLRNDIIEGSFESLACVLRTIALIETSENPPPDHPRLQAHEPWSAPRVFKGCTIHPKLGSIRFAVFTFARSETCSGRTSRSCAHPEEWILPHSHRKQEMESDHRSSSSHPPLRPHD